MFYIEEKLKKGAVEWIMSALSAYGVFVTACDRLDKRILALSLDRGNYFLGAENLAAEVCGLAAKKNRIINLKLLCDRVRDGLAPALWQTLCDRFVENDSVEEIAARLGVAKNTVLSRIGKGLKQAAFLLKEGGFDEVYFEREFGEDKHWLRQAYVARC